ncbi:hypothetical protein M0804_014966 [Polistes exclamans]|nr:hypothetical protein M0804_014966 [Polistes exclamans]
MGNPASPVLTNLVMNYILKKIEGTLPFPVPFLKVHVDDIFTAIPKDGIDLVLKTLNSNYFRYRRQLDTVIEGTIIIRIPRLLKTSLD